MKIKNYIAGIFTLLTFIARSQTFTIPDPHFVTYLQTHSTCMTGNQMSLACAHTIIYINAENDSISDLTGVENFTSLQELYCDYNQLTSIPVLSNTVWSLGCSHNQLTTLPALPSALTNLGCDHNQLASLPPLPASLNELYCTNNQLTGLPALPPLLGFHCDSNHISCFPIIPNTIFFPYTLLIKDNPFTCLPNYTAAMDAGTLAFPLCIENDTVNNPHGCNGSNGVTGYVFKDSTGNCLKDAGDLELVNIPLKLVNTAGTVMGRSYSFPNGLYDINVAPGTYNAMVDTTSIPLTAHCLYPGIDSTVVLTVAAPLASNVNFDLDCKLGFDIGVRSVVTHGAVFPGVHHSVTINAGDMSHWYNFNCSAGVSGQVQVTLSGPATFTGVQAGALVPSVAGNVFTYSIADFGTINNLQDFGLVFNTDTNAVAGDRICVSVVVTPVAGDNDSSNNTFNFCYNVVNSFDPNQKEVDPEDLSPGYQGWLTYTVHFQNTGTAPAMNIRLLDTLSDNLDLATFQIMNYSHYNTVSLSGKILTFRFPHIMLPDSTADMEGSTGFVQYRVKPKPGLPLGTQIKNTAYIFFDYNPPVVTNTTLNQFVQPLSVAEKSVDISFNVYPNPGNGNYVIAFTGIDNKGVANIGIYNLLGELVFEKKTADNLLHVDLNHQPNGIYIVKINKNGWMFNQRLVKQ